MRVMNESANLTNIIKNKEIKSTLVGGFDKNSTYEFIRQIIETFQRSLDAVVKEEEETKKKLAQANVRLESMDRMFKSVSDTACGDMKNQRDAEQLRRRVEQLERELEQVRRERDAALADAGANGGEYSAYAAKASRAVPEFERRMDSIEHRLDEMMGFAPSAAGKSAHID